MIRIASIFFVLFFCSMIKAEEKNIIIIINGNDNIIQIGNNNKVFVSNLNKNNSGKKQPNKSAKNQCDESLLNHQKQVEYWKKLMSR